MTQADIDFSDLVRSTFGPALFTGDWPRDVSFIAAVHIVFGLVIGLAPAEVVVTDGSRPVFQILPAILDVDEARAAWAVAYIITGLFVLALSWRPSKVGLMHFAWVPCGFTNGIWSLVFLIAAFNNQGSALGAVIFPTLLLWSGFAGVRVAQGIGGTGVAARSGGTTQHTG